MGVVFDLGKAEGGYIERGVILVYIGCTKRTIVEGSRVKYVDVAVLGVVSFSYELTTLVEWEDDTRSQVGAELPSLASVSDVPVTQSVMEVSSVITDAIRDHCQIVLAPEGRDWSESKETQAMLGGQ